MAVFELTNYIAGKKTRKGRMIVPKVAEPIVTVVTRDSIDAFIGAATVAERRAHLRSLRDSGLLIHNRGRLQQVVRVPGGRIRAYVFRCPWRQVPPCPQPGRARDRKRRIQVVCLP